MNVNKTTVAYIWKYLTVKLKRMKAISAVIVNINEVVVQQVFGLLKHDGKVYTIVIPNTQSATLLPIIWEKWNRTPLFTRIFIRAMMFLMWANFIIFASTTS